MEQLCRDITRPALANKRAQTNAAEQAVLKLKTPWRDGTTGGADAKAKAKPRLHLIRFGVRMTSLREVSAPPASRAWCAGPLIYNFRQAARAGGAARGAASTQAARPGSKAR